MRRLALALLLPLAACPDDGATTPDTGDTTTPDTPDTADTELPEDTSLPDDTGLPDDTDTTLPGRTVAGTALEGVTIAWPSRMTLCSDWNEGASLADEKARKVIIEVPAQTRTTLDEDALRAGRFEGLVVRTNPFANGLFRPSSSAERTSTTTWQLLDGSGGDDSLAVTVEHPLEGKAGTLIETYNVGRADGTPAAVDVTPESFEVTFAYQPWGSTLQPVRLVRCGGAPDFEDAVSVVHATSGKDWVTLLRFWRTPPGGGFDAGSYPVALVGHRIISSDTPWWPTEVDGFWSHTYAAQHHNWDDATEVDLTRDLRHYHGTFRERTPETEPISKVVFEGLLGFDDGAVTVERTTDSGVVSKRYTVADPRSFIRVDAAKLARTYATACQGPAPDIYAAGGSDHLVQVLFCGGARPSVVGLVPVIWSSDPTFIGQRFDPHTSASGEWSFAMGTRSVTVFSRPDDMLELLINDELGELVMQAVEPRGPLAMKAPWFMPVTAEAVVAGEPLSFELERIWVTYGVGKSQIWAPTHFTVTYAGTTWHIESWDRMAYTNTHHNWEDELSAEADDGTTLHWKTSFFDGTPNILTITGPGGEVILPPTVLRKDP